MRSALAKPTAGSIQLDVICHGGGLSRLPHRVSGGRGPGVGRLQ